MKIMNWKERLKQLRYDHLEKTAPGFFYASGGRSMKVRGYSDKTANGLTKAITDFLNYSGWQAERISNTGRVIDRRTKYIDVLGHRRQIGSLEWVKGAGTKGTADISATIAGKSVKIEVKIGADRQSEAQKKYQQQILASGGLYFIATGMEQFLKWYEKTFKEFKTHQI